MGVYSCTCMGKDLWYLSVIMKLFFCVTFVNFGIICSYTVHHRLVLYPKWAMYPGSNT